MNTVTMLSVGNHGSVAAYATLSVDNAITTLDRSDGPVIGKVDGTGVLLVRIQTDEFVDKLTRLVAEYTAG